LTEAWGSFGGDHGRFPDLYRSTTSHVNVVVSESLRVAPVVAVAGIGLAASTYSMTMRFPGTKLSHADHLRHAYLDHFASHRRERLFLSTSAFFTTFAITRAITHAIKAGKGPFHNIGGDGGTHVHHMTFGIVANLLVGYLWILQVGTQRHPSPHASRVTSLIYGAGAALTLDEFALWLNLEDDYWTGKGRESIDAIVLFGTLLAAGAFGGGIFQKFTQRLRTERHSKESAKIVTLMKQRGRRLQNALVNT
jgi:hypothetical protein